MAVRKAPPIGWQEWAPLEGDRQLMKRFHLAGATVTRLRRQTGLYRTVGHSNHKRPVPADFAAKAKIMHKAALRRHYEATGPMMERWIKETGVEPIPTGSTMKNTTVVTMPRIWRDTSYAGQCAEFLKHKDPIFRCDADGNQDQRGGFWFWLQRVRTDDFIIATAERKGFDARARERLAA